MTVEFHFMIKRYVPFRLRQDPEQGEFNEPINVSGVKSLKLFKSWFKLMKNKKRLLYGVAYLSDGRRYIWQPEFLNRGGWQLA